MTTKCLDCINKKYKKKQLDMKYNILELKNIQKEKNTVKSFKVSYKRFEI